MSSGSINDIAIKLGIDATGVATGMKHATAEALRASRDVEKAESLEREYNIKQQLDDIDNANKARMKSEEAFSKWYAQTLEEEFQVWYQLELRKEKEAETFAVNRQQAAINQANALSHGQWQTQFMPTETFDRRLELDKLQEDLEKRYAIIYAAQDKEERLRRNARLVENRNEQEARQHGLGLMREDQAARERSVAESARREQAILDKKAADTLAKSKLEHDNRVLERNNADIAAAARVLNSLMTVQERYAVELAKLTSLHQSYNMATGQALLTDQQFAKAKAALTLAAQMQQQAMNGATVASARAGNMFGGMAGAMTQASYAAEDFIQVLSMGGGLNMALMSASNNLSMVVRSLAGTSGMLASIAGFGVPVMLIGIGALIQYMMREEEQVNNVRHAYERLRAELDRVHESRSRMLELKFALEDIALIDDLEAALTRINEEQRERLRIEEKIAQNKKDLKAAQDDANKMLTGQAGVGEYIAELMEMRKRVEDTVDDQKILGAALQQIDDAIQRVTESYNGLQDALAQGSGEDVIAAAMRMQQTLASMPVQSGDAYDAMKERLDEILSSGESIDIIVKRINEEFANGAKLTEELAGNAAELVKLEQQRKDLLEQQNNALRMAQEEYLLKLKMTEAERELYDLRKAQEDFMGPAASRIMRGEGPLQEADQDAAMAFLEGQRDALRKDLEALVPEIIVKAGLEQSALDAQAKAFEQMQQASAKKPDPQIERTNRLLESIDNAIKNGGRIEVIQ
jgi:hypothetical protein